MSAQAVICGLTAAFFLWATWACIRTCEDDRRWTIGCFAVAVLFAYFSYQGTTPAHLAEVAAEDKARAAREERERTPHVIREADGCKVYAWKGATATTTSRDAPTAGRQRSRTIRSAPDQGSSAPARK